MPGIEFLDLAFRGLRYPLNAPLQVGLDQYLTLGIFNSLHDFRLAVELFLHGLLNQQLLIDQIVQNPPAGRFRLPSIGRSQARKLEVHLMNGDFITIHLGRRLGRGFCHHRRKRSTKASGQKE